MKKADFWLIGILLLCAAAAKWLLLPQDNADPVVAVYVNKEKAAAFSLYKDTEAVIEGKNDLSLTLNVKDGNICVSRADCPDKVCMQTAPIHKTNESILCLPAQIVITIESAEESEYDSIAR